MLSKTYSYEGTKYQPKHDGYILGLSEKKSLKKSNQLKISPFTVQILPIFPDLPHSTSKL